MINNIQDLFAKYKANLSSKKDLEVKTISFFKEKLGLEIDSKNIKLDLKNKRIKIINTNSSFRFVLKNKIDNDLLELFKKEIDLKLEI